MTSYVVNGADESDTQALGTFFVQATEGDIIAFTPAAFEAFGGEDGVRETLSAIQRGAEQLGYTVAVEDLTIEFPN